MSGKTLDVADGMGHLVREQLGERGVRMDALDCIYFESKPDQPAFKGWVQRKADKEIPLIACVTGDPSPYERWVGNKPVRVVVPAALDPSSIAERIAGEWHFLEQQEPEEGFFVACAPSMKKLLRRLKSFSQGHLPVLVLGQSGTGKEMFARLLWRFRGKGELVPVNCAMLRPELAESELFGHERGSFSGADRMRRGLWPAEGVLFLDEIGELTLDVQAMLLRVIEENKIRRVGGNTWHMVQAQLVLATNRDLELEVDERRFRSDLYQRISPLSLEIPALCRRMEELPVLACHFIAIINKALGSHIGPPKRFCDLFRYHWPGNLRQLHGWIYEAMLLAEDKAGPLPMESISERIREQKSKTAPTSSENNPIGARSVHFTDMDGWRDVERRVREAYLTALYHRTEGNVQNMIDISGLSRATLYADLRDFNIRRKS